LHWPAPAAFLRRYVPPVLAIDQFDGQAWVSLVVMRMHVMNTALPFPTLRFNQVNLRTYVRYGEHSGIWFFSVHANHHLAVTTARLATPIPYQVAFIQYGFATSEKFAHAKCNRSCRLQLALRFSVNAELAVSDPLHTWLLERYHLFTLGATRAFAARHLQASTVVDPDGADRQMPSPGRADRSGALFGATSTGAFFAGN
jgi:uncharacterized protein YqjF (DUF2071 family)